MQSRSLRILAIATTSLLIAACAGDTGAAGSNNGGADDAGASRIDRYMTADTDTKLVIEVDYVSGYLPNDRTDELMVDRLSGLVDKPNGVEIVHDEELESRGEDHVWTFEELDELLDDTDNLEVADGTVKMHVVFVDGGYEEDMNDSKILGLAWAHENIAIFEETLRSACDRPLLGTRFCTAAETSIWTHEVGHILGLVNNGAPLTAEHWDEENGKHCTNEDCIMYWTYEGEKLLDLLSQRMMSGNGDAVGFGPDCLSDLDAIGQ